MCQDQCSIWVCSANSFFFLFNVVIDENFFLFFCNLFWARSYLAFPWFMLAESPLSECSSRSTRRHDKNTSSIIFVGCFSSHQRATNEFAGNETFLPCLWGVLAECWPHWTWLPIGEGTRGPWGMFLFLFPLLGEPYHFFVACNFSCTYFERGESASSVARDVRPATWFADS